MKTTLTLVILIATPTALANDSVYNQKPPKSYCVPVETVDSRIQSCKDNRLFFEAAKRCFDDFQKLRTKVTLQLQAKLSKAAQQQSENFQANETDLAEAAAAHAYLIKIGEQAVQELDDYFDFFEHPADAETDEEVLEEPCYIQPADRLNDLVNELEEQVEEMKAAKAAEMFLSKTSGARKSNLGSLNSTAPVKSEKTSSAPQKGPKGKDIRKSDISGTEEKKTP